MPFTPFHLGPGLLVALLCLRWLDFPTVLAASVLVDLRTALVFFEFVRLPQPAARRRVLAGALVGAWFHVLLDATLYTDMQPFAPVTATNPFLGLAGPMVVYGGCLVTGVVGVALYVASVFDVVTFADADAV